MAATFELTPEIRAEIGRESEAWTYEVTTTGVRAFARGVGYDDPVYYDPGAVRAGEDGEMPAPPCFLGTPVYLPGRSDPVFSGPPGTGPRPRYGLTDVLDGGTEVVYERPLHAGETLTATVRVVDLTVKQSRSLGTMLIVDSEATFRDGQGDVAARERTQYIFY
jgi:hypothetical protein